MPADLNLADSSSSQPKQREEILTTLTKAQMCNLSSIYLWLYHYTSNALIDKMSQKSYGIFISGRFHPRCP